ncbi:MAG: caspase family protein [Gammaproteobacteria bacterium]|nr:caspase family protein [Gammaproteobacteria bacterium]
MNLDNVMMAFTIRVLRLMRSRMGWRGFFLEFLRRRFHQRIIVAIIAAGTVVHATAKESAVVNRHAIIAGANIGGKDRTALKYAQSDAKMVAAILTELGGVDASRSALLFEPTPEELLASIKNASRKLRAQASPQSRAEFVFYYSGHSDERGLLLGERLLEYRQLRDAFNDVPADVKVAILDSCASGAFTRIKGGKVRPAFLSDESSKIQGHAYLASSSAEESAQESDAIRGSYFTHYLASAMRGAADTSSDKRVTLNEAYQYAFNETLARTQNSLYGVQHAAYDIQLAGAGDLVLTDVSSANAALILPKDQIGRFFVRDLSGNLVVEINKSADKVIQLGMEPGKYSIHIEKGGEHFQAEVVLTKDTELVFQFQQATRVSTREAVARGGGVLRNENEYTMIDTKISVFPDVFYASQTRGEKKEVVKKDFNLFLGRTERVDGFSVGLFTSFVDEDVDGLQASFFINYTGRGNKGAQGSGWANIAMGNVSGAQGTGGVNYIAGDADAWIGAGGFNVVRGALVGGVGAGGFNVLGADLQGGVGSGGFNVVRGNVKGALGAGGFNVTGGNLDGGAGSAGFNVVRGDVKGGVGAAGFNVVGESLEGGAGSAGFNVVRNQVKGGMGSVGFNVAGGDVDGVQGALGFNVIGGKLMGVQFSALNIARQVEGVQLGVVNIASQFEGVPIGLISLSKNGRHDVAMWTDEHRVRHVGFKSGTQSVYNLLSVSLDRYQQQPGLAVQWGVGKLIPFAQYFYSEIDAVVATRVHRKTTTITIKNAKNETQQLDINGYCVVCASNESYMSLRVAGGVKLARYFKIFAGVSVNAAIGATTQTYALSQDGIPLSSDAQRATWLGGFAGVEF